MTVRCAPLIALVLVAGCGDDGVGAPLADFEVTAPDGFVELVPGETVTIAWQVSAAPSDALVLSAATGDEPALTLYRGPLRAGQVAWDGRAPDQALAAAGNYQLTAAALGPDDGVVATVDVGAGHLIVLQGVRFRDATLDFTGAQATRELVLTTVTRSVMELTLAVDPDLAVAGDERPLSTATIPGELVPTTRSYPFTGRTADDQPLAGGRYTLAALVRARAGARTYRVDGPVLTWTP